MPATWEVRIRGGALTDEEREALDAAEVVLLGGHGGPSGGWSYGTWLQSGSEHAAIAHVQDALRGLGFYGIESVQQLPYTVHLEAPPDEAAALEEATATGPDEIAGILTDESEGTVEVVIEVVADTPGDAWEKAHAVYALLRAAAGLSPILEASGWVVPPPELEQFLEPRHDDLFASAQTLLASGQNGLAVIVAQTACEVYMARAIRDLLRRHIQRPSLRWSVPGLVRSYSMHSDRRSQELWEALTNTKIQQQDEWWDDYCEHVKRRNRVVHEGALVTPAEAQDSLDSAASFLSFVREASRHAPPADEAP